MPETRLIDATALDLDQALQLLQQAGALLPDEAPGSAGWLQAVLDALCDLSSKDALTGLVNRRSFEMSLAREVDRVARAGEPALLLVLDIEAAPGQMLNVTVSLGGAFAPQWVRSSPLLWMERADRQLYRAKAEGRNRACLEPQVDSLVSAEEKGMLYATLNLESQQDLP